MTNAPEEGGRSDDPLDDAINPAELFEKLGDDPDCRGRPDDYPGLEIQTVLHTCPGCVAGKQYKPDPTGARRATIVSDYRLGTEFVASFAAIESLEDVHELLRGLSVDKTAFLVRGTVAEWAGKPRRRRSTKEIVTLIPRRMVGRHDDGALEDECRQLQMLDLDGLLLPAGMSVIDDPKACIEWAVDNLLPPEFRDASFVYQLSSSAGLTKLDDRLCAHLWFFTDHPFANDELRHWGGWWNAKQQNKVIDTAVFNPVQPHYTNDPELLDGLLDPFAGRRLGLVRRTRRTVRLYMPTEAELAEAGRAKSRRARLASERLGTRNPESAETIWEDQTEGPERGDEAGINATGLGPIKLGHGWRGYLAAIGFEGHIRTQIRAAIGSYFYEHGSRADRRILKTAIEEAVAESQFLDCDEPWSRSRAEALEYLAAIPSSRSNVDAMVADIAQRQRATERRAAEICEPTWSLPILTSEEAFARVQSAVDQAVSQIFGLRQQRVDAVGGADPSVFFETPPRTAILCDPGVGKTEAMIRAIIKMLRADSGVSIAVAVPTHHLGKGLADRINRAIGSTIASEWYGTDHADPQDPVYSMCRLADAARELRSAGGKLQLLCSRRDGVYCPHHPKVALENACGYLRQQQLGVGGSVRVWIVPAAMLPLAPPPAIRAQVPVLDLLVIDEGPWFSLIAGVDETRGIRVDYLSPEWWWQRKPSRVPEQDWRAAMETLGTIHQVLVDRTPGPISAETFHAAGLGTTEAKQARRVIWRCKADLRKLILPGASHPDLIRGMGDVGSTNRQVMAVADVLRIISMHLETPLPPSGVELVDQLDTGRFLRVRYRQEIHPYWLRAPVLYFDAAGAGAPEIARAWLPELKITAEARAIAPHMRVAQIVDTPISYRKLLSDGPGARNTSATQEKLARIVDLTGSTGLVICPKQLREVWESSKRLPRWQLWNFGGIRGRYEGRDVRQLVVISRPLPPPRSVEMLAETIFGHEVAKLPAASRYPLVAVGRLMSDGSGRRARTYRHPDPLVEVVRFAITEGEVLQAIGRGRGVRRTAATPLDTLLLTDLPIPLPVDAALNWKELCDAAGPIEALLARRVVPLDYRGIAAALPSWFPNGKSAMEWFRYRLEAEAMLRQMREIAERDGCFHPRELVGKLNRIFPNDNSHLLGAYQYRRTGERQSSIVLIGVEMLFNERSAVEPMLGYLDQLELLVPGGSAVDVEAEDTDTAPPERDALHSVQRFFAELRL